MVHHIYITKILSKVLRVTVNAKERQAILAKVKTNIVPIASPLTLDDVANASALLVLGQLSERSLRELISLF